jgi:Uma2 family endonuclease
MASVAPQLETGPIGNDLFIPDGLYEVVDDRIVEKPPLGVLGATLTSLLIELMGPYARSMQLGQVFSEVLFDLRPLVDGSRRPDLAFLSAAKWPLNRRGPEAESWPMIPDLAIEIVSPSDYAAKVLEKVREYG